MPVLDCEAVPCDRRGFREVGRLVEYALLILSVKDGGVRLKVALGEVVVGRLVARKAAIHVHALHHVEGVVGGGIAVVGARRNPHHGVVRLCQGLGILD